MFSADEGKTWTKPTVVNDSPVDDRNPALGQAANGDLVIGFWRTATYDENGQYNPKLDKPRNTWTTRSEDGGTTWSEPTELDVTDIGWGSPFGKILAAMRSRRGGQVWLAESRDDGETWDAPKPVTPNSVHPADLVLLPDGRVLMDALRCKRQQRAPRLAGPLWSTHLHTTFGIALTANHREWSVVAERHERHATSALSALKLRGTVNCGATVSVARCKRDACPTTIGHPNL